MKKYSTKRHLSLEIAEKEDWSKHNYTPNRTYRNVNDNWRSMLDKASSQEKSKLFFKYAFEGNRKMLKVILAADGEAVNIDSIDKDGNNALMYAVKSGDLQTIKFLVEQGIEINCINNLGFSPLHLAVRKNNIDIVAVLYDNGADLNIEDCYGQTPIYDAIYENNTKMIEALIINNPLKNVVNITRNNNLETPLIHAAKSVRRQDALLTLLSYNANVNTKDKYGRNALMHAINNGCNPLMDILLKHDLDLNAKDNACRTSLMYAARKGNRECLRILIARGADVLAKDIKGKTAYDYAVKYGFKGCAEILAKAQKIVNSNLSEKDKTLSLKQFAKHNRVENSCAR